ncbi:MAG: Spy/CpxP family protein refolding chaperone [Legionellaceae bacterium]|nr:Spy/CpxP family protein refolding chaperone [Legionellaceae bacterium]
MYKQFLGIVSLACTLVFSQAVFADEWGCGEGLKHMVASLKLDDAQKAQIEPILEELKNSHHETGLELRDIETQLHQQIYAVDMDQSAVNSLIDKKTKLIGDMIKTKVVAQNKIFAILNPEQRSQLQEMIKNLKEKIAAKYKSCAEQE